MAARFKIFIRLYFLLNTSSNDENVFFLFQSQTGKEIMTKLNERKENKCLATCDFQQCSILTSVDSDEPVQPPFTLRNSK